MKHTAGMLTERCLLVCAGEEDTVPIDMQAGDFLIAVDGGLARVLREGLCPSLILGDFDSLDPSLRSYADAREKACPSDVLRYPVEKDDTDTMAAAREGWRRGCRHFVLLDAAGGRPDHFLANLQVLVWLARRGASAEMRSTDRSGRRTTIRALTSGDTYLFPDTFEGTFSLLALSDTVEDVTITGAHYPAEHLQLTNDYPIGISNEIHAQTRGPEAASIRIGTGTAALILIEGLRNTHA
ncbi:MAG: thiamine diphosphokinase [Lachnospiraceae bacterium]|nr:thiamine diphosphokinase [Lachnospiraceae bacterium]